MKVERHPLQPEDIRDIEPRHVHGETAAVLARGAEKLAALPDQYAWFAPSGQVLVTGGLLPNGFLWALVSPACRDYTVSLTRDIRKLIGTAKQDVFAEISPQDARARRFAEALGFRPHEGKVYRHARAV